MIGAMTGGRELDVAAFIIAGGKSSRMGEDKALVTVDGRTLLAHALQAARSVTPEVSIVGDSAKFQRFAPVVEDAFRGCGPLAGIHAALKSSRAELNLMLAVDLPFVSFELLQFMVTQARGAADATVTIARAGGRWQPLCAVYRRDFGDPADNALRQGRYKIDALFDHLRMRVISGEELESAGFPARMFRNLNTPEELAEAGGHLPRT